MLKAILVNRASLARYDFGETIPFKLYNEDNSAFDASTFTGAVAKTYKQHGDRAFWIRDVAKALTIQGQLGQIINDIDVSWTDQANGEGTFAYTQSDRPSIAGYNWVSIQVTKTGAQISSDLIRMFIQPSEAA